LIWIIPRLEGRRAAANSGGDTSPGAGWQWPTHQASTPISARSASSC
jgi:hypothetical protein